MPNPAYRTAITPNSTPQGAVAVTPNDTNDLVIYASRGLFINAIAGATLKIDPIDGAGSVTFTFVAAFTGIHNVAARRVYATGTSAGLTGIVALY